MDKPAGDFHPPPDRISELISCLMTAISSCGLYSAKHPVVREFSARAFGIIEEFCSHGDVHVTLIGESVIFNDVPFIERKVHIVNFIRRLRRKKIDKIIFSKTPDLSEMDAFVIGMASGGKVPSTGHISVGVVEVRLKNPGDTADALLDGGLSRVRETFQGVSRFRELDMVGLEDAVIDFLGVLKKEMNILRIVGPVKTHNEYTYVHATNVSVLSIFQAERLGFPQETLRDIGLAGLLHDVGKMFVTNEVLDKKGKLDECEWTEMKKHPVYGALYLARLSEAPPLAAIVAFEHHMKFNGTGYPETKRTGKTQHIVSQIVAISDFFDALRTTRPYRKPLEVPAISRMMREGMGTDFNPVLVEKFLASLEQISAPG
ncbi:MAG: HD domain-containing protein [Nitrospiraceae bacterium]|nr:HD domain-containing protein [Nitrospiraceae bacterium]